LHRLHEVASFYPLYRLQPPRPVEVKVCRDMACHLRAAPRLLQGLQELAEASGGKVGVTGVSCLGQCDDPVAASINEHIYHGLAEEELGVLVRTAAEGQPLKPQHADRTPAGWKIDPYNGRPAYEAIRSFVKLRDADAAIKALETANLRGMGGAGFPTFFKWNSVRSAAGDVKYVICNADESEPGTFKDRELLRRTPWLVVEGMVLAGLVTGASQGWVYIRHEYHDEAEALADALDQARSLGACGENIFGSGLSFAIEVFVSPGGYIQGEESALLEAMEDRRGEPRNKPPYPVSHGLFGKPTVINNVETLAWVPAIVLRGGQWYNDQGTNGATGLRLVSICGDVNRPGVYEVPFGQTVRELIHDSAGGIRDGLRLKAIAPSGPSGGFWPARVPAEQLPASFVQRMVREDRMEAGAGHFDILNLPLDLTTLGAMGGMLGGAFVVYGDGRDMLEQALNCVQFFRNESCGKCVPCRLGSQQLTDMIQAMLAGKFPAQELGRIGELAETMYLTSICGLGQVAANPITSVLKYFPEDVKRHVQV
jgi:NADH:ubiquinone oxidoreductase subunit F (NADH-binding)